MHTSDQSKPTMNSTISTKPEVKYVVVAGTFIISFFLMGFSLWSTHAPLNSAAIAPGYIAVEKGRKSISHLEGGILQQLSVAEGDAVKAGQPLIRLSDTNSNATLDLLRSRHMLAQALEARLESEYEGLTALQFPKALVDREDENIKEILENQKKIFKTRQDAINQRKAILNQRVGQLREEITGLKEQIKSEEGRLALIKEEIDVLKDMLKKGLTPKSRLLMLQRREYEIQGRRSMHKSQIARARQSIGETKLRVAEIYTTRNSEVAEQLRAARADIYDLNQRLKAAADVQQRTEILSPINGTVVNLKANTLGGVIRPGETLMEIVPLNERLLVEAKLEPSDIDVVHAGMEAKIRLTAFSQRTTAPEDGVIESVSADHIMDESTGKTYYLARIAIYSSPLQREGKEPLRPGMEAEVMIDTGARTLVEYMFEPLIRSFNRAFRET